MAPNNKDTPDLPLGFTAVHAPVHTLLGCNAIRGLLARHAAGDWGEISAIQARANALALHQGYLVRSEYFLNRIQIQILTNEDRTRTYFFAAERR